MLQENELVNLFSGVAAALVMVFFARRMFLASLRLFYVAFVAMLVAYIATVLEGFFWPDPLNLLEHAALAIAGWGFAAACWRLRHTGAGDGEEG